MTYLWQMTLLGGICTLLLMMGKPWLLKKCGGKWYCGLWILVLFTYISPYQFVFFTPYSPTGNTTSSTTVFSAVPDIPDAVLPMEAKTVIPKGNLSFAQIQMVIYGIGLAGFAIYYLMSYFSLQRRIRQEAELIYCKELERVKSELGIHRNIILKAEGRIQTPLFFGVVHPTILLPQKAYGEEELYFLLCHELTHYKRHHMYFRLLALAVHILHWFNPLSYVALRQIQEACEYACDEGVTESMNEEKRLAYGYLLLCGASPGRTSVFSLGFRGNRKKDVLKRRLTVIMEKQKKKKIQKVGIAVLAVGTLAVCSSFFDLKPIYAGADTQQTQQTATELQGFWWTDHVKTEKDAISLATEYVEKMLHGDVENLMATAEYHDGQDNSIHPKGWFIQLSSSQPKEQEREYAVWLEIEGNRVSARQKSLQNKTQNMSKNLYNQSKAERDALLQDTYWVTEAKKIVQNSTWQKEEIVDATIVPQEQYDVVVQVDTAGGAKYLVSFHPWKELSSVQYCPPVQESIQKQDVELEHRLAETIAKMENVEQVKVNMRTNSMEGKPSVFVTTKDKQPLVKENIQEIQELVARSIKGMQVEDVSVYCNEKMPFSVGQRTEVPSVVSMTMEDDAAKEETAHIIIEDAQTVLVESNHLPSGLPVKGEVSTVFDEKKHPGIDLDTHKKALPIVATADGTVKEAKFDPKMGNYIVMDHGNGYMTKYAHNSKNLVKVGDTVAKGKEIALAGQTGMATGIHCHYEVWENGIPQNPHDFM